MMADAALPLVLELRPTPAQGVTLHERIEGGKKHFVLKHGGLGRYHALTSLGAFIFRRLDGRTGIGQLVDSVQRAGGVIEASGVLAFVDLLARQGFVDQLPQDERRGETSVPRPPSEPPPRGLLALARRCEKVLTWTCRLRRIDPLFDVLHRAVVAPLAHRAVLLGWLVLCLSGLYAFISMLHSGWGPRVSAAHVHAGGVAALILAMVIAGVCHELAHGLAVKHYGREVISMGVGWYWFGPVFLVDTSDMWLGTARQRIVVSLAGPATDAAAAAVAALICPHLPWSVALYVFAFAANVFTRTLYCLSPLMLGDGYWILSDLSRRRNLRGEAFSWLARDFWRDVRRLSALRRHWIDLVYGVSSLAYLAVMIVVNVILWREIGVGFLPSSWPPAVGIAIGWALPAVIAVPMLLSLYSDVRRNIQGAT
jgi:putative peptide zinc metalloprotease protein